MKEVSLSKTVYELCTQHPDLVEAMRHIGFVNITKPGMLQSAGRIMTIPKGSRAMGIPLEDVKKQLMEHGFKVIS
jgi:formate-dependent phosphoribosylglycinamide formyltransferase (GAR transformylase)